MSIAILREWSKKWLTTSIDSSSMLDALAEYDALSDKLDAMTAERNKLLARVVELEKREVELLGVVDGLHCSIELDRAAMAEKSRVLEQMVAEATTREAEAIARADVLENLARVVWRVQSLRKSRGERFVWGDQFDDIVAAAMPFFSTSKPCAHSHTVDLKCTDCGTAVPAADPLAQAVAKWKEIAALANAMTETECEHRFPPDVIGAPCLKCNRRPGVPDAAPAFMPGETP